MNNLEIMFPAAWRRPISFLLCNAGAELFESLLVDHDVGVNYCNWNYFAGIGNDPRDRRFKAISQGMLYDKDAELMDAWLPELRSLPPNLRHQPFDLPNAEPLEYPSPMVEPSSQLGKKK